MLGKIKGASVSKTNILRKALISKIKIFSIKGMCVCVCLCIKGRGEGKTAVKLGCSDIEIRHRRFVSRTGKYTLKIVWLFHPQLQTCPFSLKNHHLH